MGIKDVFRRVLHPAPTPPVEPPERGSREWAGAWLDAREKGELDPPRDIHDAAAWNTYWTNHMRFGQAEQGFSDMMSSDDHLIDLLVSRSARTILCAGNGASTEALGLAQHGFHVTVLDIASVPLELIAGALRNPEFGPTRIPGYRITDDAFVFGDSGPIPQDACLQIHRAPNYPPQAGGTLAMVTGDLTDPDRCPGPFDVVIERRTVQLFPYEDRQVALDRLVARLGERGLFVSHHHDPCGGPNRRSTHFAMDWARSRGFLIDYEVEPETRRSAKRLARLTMTTG